MASRYPDVRRPGKVTPVVSIADFEAARPQLMAVAFRLLGSRHDAEDAVQTTWLRTTGTEHSGIRNTGAWLTTVLTRVCLDQLRTRRRRGEEPLLADMIPEEQVGADERYLQREEISRALMLLLDRLTPGQRIAYVLHDLFDMPFAEVAETLDTTESSAKKHASRARQRVERTAPITIGTGTDHAVVDAFLAAAAGGDLDRMVALMSADCVRTVDPTLVPAGTPAVVHGSRVIAEETRYFVDRIRTSVAMTVGGRSVRVIAPGGHPLAILTLDTRGGVVMRIAIARASASDIMSLSRTPEH